MNIAAPKLASVSDTTSLLTQAEQAINKIILGKPTQVRLALACLFARGHLLIEDVPGVGKTTLAHTLSIVLGLPFSRIQFTSDLLPADVVGVSTFDAANQKFHFHNGPIFSSVVLADEINRATPKTQSALLEAMEEEQITVDGETRALPKPFFVIATQNPRNQIGTFPLPESQMDRFMMRIKLGYPDRDAEKALLLGENRRDMLHETRAIMDTNSVLGIQHQCREVKYTEALVEYVQALVDATRSADHLEHGLSPRAALSLIQCAQAWALLSGRKLVLPEDVQAVAVGTVAHRLVNRKSEASDSDNYVEQLIRSIPIP